MNTSIRLTRNNSDVLLL